MSRQRYCSSMNQLFLVRIESIFPVARRMIFFRGPRQEAAVPDHHDPSVNRARGPAAVFFFLWRNHIIFLSKHWPRVSHRKLFSSPIPPLSGKTHLNIQLLGSSVSQTLSLAKLARSKAIGHINDSIKRWHQLQRFAQFALDATRK